MSILIDDIHNDKVNIGGEWWIAKPCIKPFYMRFKDCLSVLTGKAEAFHYKEDECNQLHSEVFK